MNASESAVTRREALGSPALVAALGLAGAGLLHWHDPHDSGAYGYCPFLLLTGRPCPGCGGMRAVNDLTRMDVGAAVSSNALAVLLVAVLIAAFVLWLPRRWHGRRDRMIVIGPKTGMAILALTLVFGVVRNTPWGSWLAP
jgi:hypothetical protein